MERMMSRIVIVDIRAWIETVELVDLGDKKLRNVAN